MHPSKAVDNSYQAQPFVNEVNRMVFLFELYERYVGGMFVEERKGKEWKPKRKEKLVKSSGRLKISCQGDMRQSRLHRIHLREIYGR